MPVVITPRATIDDAFTEWMKDAYMTYLLHEKEKAVRHPGGKDRYLKERAPAHARALKVLQVAHSDGRMGMEYEKTRLRSLPYARFTVVERNGERYGAGVTKPILITMPEGEMHAGTWHLGPYAVYVPFSAIEEQNAGRFHFIPLKNPKANNRFPHHYCEKRYDDDVHPLDRSIYTCWGSFSAPIAVQLDALDVPELFRTLQIYLSRYDPHSPLRYIDELDFDTRSPWVADRVEGIRR